MLSLAVKQCVPATTATRGSRYHTFRSNHRRVGRSWVSAATSTRSESSHRPGSHGSPQRPNMWSPVSNPSRNSRMPPLRQQSSLGSMQRPQPDTTLHRLPTRTMTTSSSPSSTAMKDEYGSMDASGETFQVSNYVLESGETLPHAQLRYQTYGTLNEDTRDNVLVVCHALTGNASLHVWWADLLGPGKPFDTSKYFVVCCNILGSCYGSTSPKSINPTTNRAYGMDFPDVSVQDTVKLQLLLLQQQLQVKSIKSVIGGSFGGMQVLEFAVQAGIENGTFTDAEGQPFVRSVVPIACGAQHTAWQIAISEVQRQAIYRDAKFATDPFEATAGLEIARQLGMVSYRTPQGYQSKFGRDMQHQTESAVTGSDPPYGSKADWKVKNYLLYQGQKFLSRFDPVTYIKMTEQMDSHDVARNRAASAREVLEQVQIPALVLGIDSDVLYPLTEQQELADMLPNSQLGVIHSEDGHDGFLLEQEQVGNYITDFLNQHATEEESLRSKL